MVSATLHVDHDEANDASANIVVAQSLFGYWATPPIPSLYVQRLMLA